MEELLAAVRRLSTVRPHEDGDRGMTRADYAVYCRGYWAALRAVLATMDLALRQRALWLRGVHRANRLAALARRRLVDEARVGEWEQVGAVPQLAAEGVDDGPKVIRRNYHAVIAQAWIGDTYHDPARAEIGDDLQVDRGEQLRGAGHPLTVPPREAPTQPQDVGVPLIASKCDAAPCGQADSSGGTSQRYVVHESCAPRRRKTRTKGAGHARR